MAEPEGGEDFASMATRKIGPFPVWVYVVLLGGAYWYLKRKQSASSAAAAGANAAGSAATTPNYGTDPAGNTGYIDPSSGYVQGSSEDLASLAQSNTGSSSSGQYSDNNAWGQAAINYLTSLGDDATAANGAIEAYLASQSLTTAQQAMVNLAIQKLGAPPQPPAPSTTTTVVSPPGGATTYATNPPTGLTVTSTSANSLGLKWNAAANATGYTITYTATGGAAQTVTSTTPSATLSGLAASTSYSISVQATPADTGAAKATTTAKTTYGAIGTPPGTGTIGTTGEPPLTPGQQIVVPANGVGTQVASKYGISPDHLLLFNPGKQTSQSTTWQVPYLVRAGDTLTSIAGKFGISPEHLAEILQSQGVA